MALYKIGRELMGDYKNVDFNKFGGVRKNVARCLLQEQ